MRRHLISFSLLLLAVVVPRAGFSQTDGGMPDTGDSQMSSDTQGGGGDGAADSSDLFLNAYMANEDGEKLESSGEPGRALDKYRYAASLLDQIAHDDPKWQPIVVDYRKKRVSENIVRVQGQLGATPAPETTSPETPAPEPTVPEPTVPEPATGAIEGELPQKAEPTPAPIPDFNAPQETPTPAPPPVQTASAPDQTRDQIDELEHDLRDSQEKLKAVEAQKEDLANRLEDTVKQLNVTEVSATEAKGQLKQAQDEYQNALSDHSQAAGNQKEYQERLSQLENALKDARAEDDALEEQNEDDVRRATLARQTAVTLEGKSAGTAALASKLTAANAKVTALTSKLTAAQNQIETVTQQRDEATAASEAKSSGTTSLGIKLAAATTKVASLTNKLAAAQSEIDTVTQQRDQALAQLGKAREDAKRVTDLMAENTTLTQKLDADEKTIRDFKSDAPEKDKVIADLRTQLSDTKALLASTQKDRQNVQSSLNDLQQQYDSVSQQLTELKASTAVSDTDKKNLTDENDLLQNILHRALRSEAARDQQKRLIISELAQLSVHSDTLMKRVDYLGEPVVQLTEKERALLKEPSIDIPDPDDSTMDINIAAPKETPTPPPLDTGIPDATPAAQTAVVPMPTPDSPPAPTPFPPPPGAPSATPFDVTSFSTPPGGPGSAFTPAPTPPPGSEESPSSGGAAAAPMVPPDLMDDARSAKDEFERGDYEGAETIYRKMLAEAPNNVYILSNLGVVYFRDQKWKLAEESLQKAIAVAPEDTFSWCTLGIVYYQEKRFDDAINALTRALAINPKYPVAHNYLGITASQKGWQEAALKELQTAIELDPNYGDAFFNLAVVYAMQQPPNKDLARRYYKRATDLGAEPDAALEQLLK